MRRHPPHDLIRFLEAVDQELDGPVDLVIIGGAAVALAYSGEKHVTADIDLLSRVTEAFDATSRAVQSRLGLLIPVGFAGSVSVPMNYEDRLQRILGAKLKKLRVFVPERHDLAMMKLARGNEHDLASLEEIHENHPFDFDTLMERYRETAPYVFGRKQDFDFPFLSLISRLFGDEAAAWAKQKIA